MATMRSISCAILFIWLVIMAGCSGSPGKADEPSTNVAAKHTVLIKEMKFQPSALAVNKGDTILFVNQDFVVHDITETAKTWSSSPLAPGKSWQWVATESAGYYCSIHPVMKGKIAVTE
jgi:plastocyanin